MSRKTLKDFLLNVKSSRAKIISLAPTKDGDGSHNEDDYIDHKDDLGIDPHTRMDLLDMDPSEAEVSIGLLGDYVKYITEELNYGIIEGGNVKAKSTDRGNPITAATEHGATETFDEHVGTDDGFTENGRATCRKRG